MGTTTRDRIVGNELRPLVCCVLIIVVALMLAVKPVAPSAHAQDDELPTGVGDQTETRENTVDLNSVNRQLFKRLFIKRRKEHLEAVRSLQKMNNYERQYKMINVMAEKMFDVIESKKALLENFTESELRGVSFAIPDDGKNDIRDAISSVLENTALFGDVVLNLPDITARILKTQPKWNSTIRWSFDFLNRTKDLLDKSTLEMIELALQELNVTARNPNYFNPNRAVKPSPPRKEPSKREKRKKGPMITRIEL